MKVLLKVITPEGPLFVCCDEDEAVGIMEEYRAVGWDSEVIGIEKKALEVSLEW